MLLYINEFYIRVKGQPKSCIKKCFISILIYNITTLIYGCLRHQVADLQITLNVKLSHKYYKL